MAPRVTELAVPADARMDEYRLDGLEPEQRPIGGQTELDTKLKPNYSDYLRERRGE